MIETFTTRLGRWMLLGAMVVGACSAARTLAQPVVSLEPPPPPDRTLRGDDEPDAPEEPDAPDVPDAEETPNDASAPDSGSPDGEARADAAEAESTGDTATAGGGAVTEAAREVADTGSAETRVLRGDDQVTADDGIATETILPVERPGEAEEADEPPSDHGDEEGSSAAGDDADRRIRNHDRIGPFLMSTERSSLQPTFAMQAQAATSNADGEEFDAQAIMRRLRFGLRARMLDDRLVARFQLNLWPDALDMLDVWLDGYVDDWISLRVGQMKIPFTQYRTGSFTSLAVVDWSTITRYFGSERQLGLMGYGTIRDRWIWDFGIFGGQNRRSAHAVRLTELYGERPTDASDLADPGPTGKWHPEFVGHVGYHGEDIGIRQLTDPGGGGLRYAVDLSVTGDAQPVTTEDLLLRLAPEVMLKYEHISWMGSYYHSLFHPTTGGAELGLMGVLTQATYRINRTWEVSGSYARGWVSSEVRTDARLRADDRIANAATIEEMTALQAQYADVGTVLGDQELVVGLNVYIVGNSLKWQTDFSWLRQYRTQGGHLDEGRFRTQLQLSF